MDILIEKDRMWIHVDTKLWIVDKNVDNPKSYSHIVRAAKLLTENEVVAFPTETVYGLGGNAYNNEAISKIFTAKGRPTDNPLIVHIGNEQQLIEFVSEVSNEAKQLMAAFWPGPLTLVLNKKGDRLAKKVTAGLSTVAVRMPDHPVALAIINEANIPIAAPSANQSGKPSPTTAAHVQADLNGKIAAIVDGGPTGIGVESTVVDCTVSPPLILRPGGVSQEQLEQVIGEVSVDNALLDETEVPKSPGVKYRHYAPGTPLYLVDGTCAFLQQLVNDRRKSGLQVGVITTKEHSNQYDADVIFICGERERMETVASQLFCTLREVDEKELDIIYAEVFPETGIGRAIMNRLLKAASNRVIKEEG